MSWEIFQSSIRFCVDKNINIEQEKSQSKYFYDFVDEQLLEKSSFGKIKNIVMLFNFLFIVF